MTRRNVLIILSFVIAGAVGLNIWLQPAPPTSEPAEVAIPEFSVQATRGKSAFEETCASCHGLNARGTGNGPTFIHKVYEPNHHADFSFQRAVKIGVRSHHWRFGNMPPQPNVSEPKVADIITYVRELQRANGIF